MTVHPEWMARIECKFDDDPRLIAGATTIVAHIARRAGLADGAAREITTAAVDACEATVQSVRETSDSRKTIQLAAAEFPDHIEVTIGVMPGASNAGRPPRSLELPSDSADKIRQRLKSEAVDGINVEVLDGTPRVTLVKNCGAAKRRFVL